jgi:hypothetical protein
MPSPAASVTAAQERSGRRARLGGIAAVVLFLALVARFWHPVWGLTAFVQLDASYDDKKIAAFHTQPVYVYRDTGPYDGVAYSQIAYDPLLGAPELRTAVDNLAYRARRILLPALAWALAGGNPAWIIQVYVLLNIGVWLVLAWLLWRLLAVDDFRSWLAWVGVLFSAGALISVRESLTDLLALMLLTAALLAVERGRRGWAVGWLAAAGLARETALAALPGLWTQPWLSWANVRRTLIALAPLAAWIGYIHWRVGPASQGWTNFTWPVAGFVEKWRASVAAVVHPPSDWALAWTTLLATGGLTVQAAYLLLRPQTREPWWRLGAAFAGMMLLLGTPVWEGYPGAALRVLLPMTLAFFVLARRRHASLAWLCAGSLTVFSGLVSLRDVPLDLREISGVRHGDEACIVRVARGWFDCEQTSKHIWAWSQGDAGLEIQAWPFAERTWRLEFSVRSLVPRTVTVSQKGEELWRGAVGAQRTQVSVPFRAAAGGASLEFSTDAPAVLENGHADARLVAFALYDPRVVLTNSR